MDALDEACEKAQQRMEAVGEWFEDLGDESKEKYAGLKQSFDHARVQLAPGQKEAGETFEERRDAYEVAIATAQSKFTHLESEVDEQGRALWGKVLDSWDEIENRLQTAYLRVMFSEVLWEARLKDKKKKFHAALVDLRSDLKEHGGDGSKALDKFLTKSEDFLDKGSERTHKILRRFFERK